MFRTMTVGSGIFWAWIFTVVIFAGLWVWTILTIDKKLPGWVANEVVLNSISIKQNERGLQMATYLIEQEGKISQLRIAMSSDKIYRALKSLNRSIKKKRKKRR